MEKRGYRRRITEDQFTINGQYARNLQVVFAKEHKLNRKVVVDLVYFAVDVLRERLVIGLYRENLGVENGVYINASRALDLGKLSAERLERELNQLIPPVKDHLK
jgi:hypothetical protein